MGLGIENPDTVLRKEVHKDSYKEVKIIDVINSIRDSGINVPDYPKLAQIWWQQIL